MPGQNKSTSEELAMLWVTTQPLVWAYIHATVRDYQHAEDVLQQVAQATAVCFDEYDSSRSFKAWAIGIAKNKIRDHFRGQSQDKLVFSGEALETIGESFTEDNEYMGAIRSTLAWCMSQLSEQARDFLRLRYSSNLKPADIATRSGMSANSVRIRLHRYRTALAKCVNGRAEKQESSE